jgi:exonuclease III
MKKINPAFLALSETRLTEDIEDSEVNVLGYSMIRCNAENRNTGGVVLYVRNDIKYEIVLVEKLESNCWCVAVEMKDKLYKGVIMVIYHSPSASHGDFMRFFEDIIEELIIKGECMIIGDFNIDLMTDSFYAKKLQTTMLSLGMKQYVNEPTRITKDSQTIIDLIFANNNKIVQVIHEQLKITDHEWLKVELSVSKIESKYREFSARNYKGFDANEFAILVKNKLHESQGCQCECMYVSERAKKLIDSIVNALDITAPRKKFRIPKVWEGKK